MSDTRLVRALERGGAVYREGDNRIPVRRERDARGRVIGMLCPKLFTALLAQGRLKRLGTIEPERYIWSGPMLDRGELPEASIKAFAAAHEQQEARTLLGHVLQALSDKAEASALRRTADWFYQDHAWEEQSGGVSGMNWRGLELGGRVDRSLRSDVDMDDPVFKMRARRRLQQVRARFSARAYNELIALILSEHTRRRFASTFGFTGLEGERRAVDLLRRLSWLYEKELAPPETLTSLRGAAAS